MAHLGPRILRPQIISPTPNKHISSPVPKVKEFGPSPPPPPRTSMNIHIKYKAHMPSKKMVRKVCPCCQGKMIFIAANTTMVGRFTKACVYQICSLYALNQLNNSSISLFPW